MDMRARPRGLLRDTRRCLQRRRFRMMGRCRSRPRQLSALQRPGATRRAERANLAQFLQKSYGLRFFTERGAVAPRSGVACCAGGRPHAAQNSRNAARQLMCDKDSIDDMLEFQRRAELSRRQFGAMTVGTSLMFMLPKLANAADVKESEVEIKTPDGTADAYFVHPSTGKHPGVLIWPDIFGLRPAFRQMGKRLAESGYAVLVVNPFYRMKKAPTSPEHADFDDPKTREMLMSLRNSLTTTTAKTDAQ